MRALMVREFGPPRSHRIEEVSDPSPGDGEVLIDVHAIGLNFPDLLMVQGKYQTQYELPFVPGRDVAGVVTETGAGISRWKLGDRVLAQVAAGAFAERVVAPESRVFMVPDEMDFVTAAAMVTPYNTAWVAVVIRGQVQEGETVLVTGASGGVGAACAQLAKARGARVIAAVSGPEKADAAYAMGVDDVVYVRVDHVRDQLREQVYAANGGRGVDVVCELIGGEVFDGAMRCLAFAGRMVIVGFASMEIPQPRGNYILLKNLSVIGAPVDIHFKERQELMDEGVNQLMRLYVDRKLRPTIQATFPLEKFHDAVKLFDDRQIRGRIVLTTGVSS